MERILMTGSHGFLGSALKKELSAQYEIIEGDRLGTYQKCDYIVDLASYGNNYAQKDVDKIYDANLLRFIRLVQSSRHCSPKGIIYTSSAAVELPVTSFYAASKLAGEAFMRTVDHAAAVIVRPYTVTGVGDQPHHLIPTLIRSCLAGERMPFVGAPMHDYIDIGDVAKSYAAVLKNINALSGLTLGIGTGIEYSNRQVKLMVERACDSKAQTYPVRSLREYDTNSWKANKNDMCLIGYIPQKSLRESIKEMVEHERT